MQGASSSNPYVTSFSLQFGSDGLHWQDYRDIMPGILSPPKVLTAHGLSGQ